MFKLDRTNLVDSLIDDKTCASLGGICRSHWHKLVGAGRAPKPAIRSARLTRWRMSDVQAWIADPSGWSYSSDEGKVAQRQREAVGV